MDLDFFYVRIKKHVTGKQPCTSNYYLLYVARYTQKIPQTYLTTLVVVLFKCYLLLVDCDRVVFTVGLLLPEMLKNKNHSYFIIIPRDVSHNHHL